MNSSSACPANAGYGLPTAYFILQGMALLAEHTRAGKRLGLGQGVRRLALHDARRGRRRHSGCSTRLSSGA